MIYKLRNTIQHYAWGKKGGDSLIKELMQISHPGDEPYAELWLGAHEKSPSIAISDSREVALDELIAENPSGMLGKNYKKLPFLAKILTIRDILSIQVHPDKALAEILHDSDPEHYPDDKHKPEIAISLNRLEALAGFKPASEIKKLLRTYPSLRKQETFQLRSDPDDQKAFTMELATAINSLATHKKEMRSMLKELQKDIAAAKHRNKSEKLFLRLFEAYPNDAGLIYCLILNYRVLEKNEAVFLGAGIPHAYIKGDLIECMANSDNVIRLGLTPKYCDPENLIKALSIAEQSDEVIIEAKDNQLIYRPPVEEFGIQLYQSVSSPRKYDIAGGRPAILLCLQGKLQLSESHAQDKTELLKGGSCFIPAAVENISVQAGCHSEFVMFYKP